MDHKKNISPGYISRSARAERKSTRVDAHLVPTSPEEPLLMGYGLGVANYSPQIFNRVEICGHSGNAVGYVAASLYLPEYGISLGIMLNTIIQYLDEKQ